MSEEIGHAKTDINIIGTDSTFYTKFKNLGSESMAVNGSVTPVVFTLEDIPMSDFLLIQRVTFVISTSDIIDLEEFGALPNLANGIQFIANGDTPEEIAEAVINNNGDVILISSRTTVESAKITGITSTIIEGSWDFTEVYGNSIKVRNNDMKIIINDDLSTMTYFKVSCHGLILNKIG